jgi:hypothetical protein
MEALRPFAIPTLFLAITVTAVFPAGARAITVEPNSPSADRWTISSAAYQMVINLASPRIDSFVAGEYALLGAGGLAPTINTGAPWGPAKAVVAASGPDVTHIVLYGMRWEKELIGDIEVHFFCYRNRVVARMDIIPRATPRSLLLGWVGEASQAAPFPAQEKSPDWQTTFNADDPLDEAAVLLPPLLKGQKNRRGAHVRFGPGDLINAHYKFYSHEIGNRSIACTFLAGDDETSLLDLLSHEVTARQLQFDVANGRFLGYDDTTGLHRFIMNPGTHETTIGVPSISQDKTMPYVAAFRDQRQRNVQLQDSPNRGAPVQWICESLNLAPPHEQNGPGSYLVPFKVLPQEQTLLLRRSEDTP